MDSEQKHIYTNVAVYTSPCPGPYPMAACPEFHVGCSLGQELFTLPTYFKEK